MAPPPSTPSQTSQGAPNWQCRYTHPLWPVVLHSSCRRAVALANVSVDPWAVAHPHLPHHQQHQRPRRREGNAKTSWSIDFGHSDGTCGRHLTFAVVVHSSMCLLSRIAAISATGCSLRSCLPVNDLDLIFVLVEQVICIPPACAVVKVVLVIRIVLDVVRWVCMSVMGYRVLRDLDLLLVVSERQRCVCRSSGTRAR